MLRDDLIVNDQYSLDAHHSEEAGKAIRKKIWFVTLLLTVITIAEVFMGASIKQTNEWWSLIKWSFIIMTVIKAGYIVMVFMHLGDERKNFKNVILIPYLLFIVYLIFILLTEAIYTNEMALRYFL